MVRSQRHECALQHTRLGARARRKCSVRLLHQVPRLCRRDSEPHQAGGQVVQVESGRPIPAGRSPCDPDRVCIRRLHNRPALLSAGPKLVRRGKVKDREPLGVRPIGSTRRGSVGADRSPEQLAICQARHPQQPGVDQRVACRADRDLVGRLGPPPARAEDDVVAVIGAVAAARVRAPLPVACEHPASQRPWRRHVDWPRNGRTSPGTEKNVWKERGYGWRVSSRRSLRLRWGPAPPVARRATPGRPRGCGR